MYNLYHQYPPPVISLKASLETCMKYSKFPIHCLFSKMADCFTLSPEQLGSEY